MTGSRPAVESDRASRSLAGAIWPAVILYVVTPLAIAGLMAYYLLLSRRVVGEFGFPLDDSWIHVRFAQNLVRGYWFSFNPGEPTSTTTGPLWTVLLGAGYRLTHEFIFTSAVMNWAICCLCALAAAVLARSIVPSRAFGAAVALVVAITIPLPWLALSGMEPPLFVLATLVAILLHLRFRRERGIKAIVPTLVFGVAVYARPELLLLFPLAMLDRLIMDATDRRPGWAVGWVRQAAIHTPIYLAVIAPLIVYNLRVIGRPLPSSYYIKAYNFGLTWALAMHNRNLVFQSAVVAPIKEVFSLLGLWATNNLALIVPFFLGFAGLVRRALRSGSRHRSLLIPLVLVAQPVAWAVSTNFHRTPGFQGQRYVANLDALYLIVGMAGVWWWLERRQFRVSRLALAAGAAAIVVASLVRQPDQARLYTHNVKNITEMQVTAGRWLKQHVPREAVLVANDVGAIAAISDNYVLDMMGLVSPETLACRKEENALNGTWLRCTWEVAESMTPDYLVIVVKPMRYDGFIRQGFKPIYEIRIDDNITCGGPWMLVAKWHDKQPASGSELP